MGGGEVVQKKGDEAMFFQDKMVYLQYKKLSLQNKGGFKMGPLLEFNQDLRYEEFIHHAAVPADIDDKLQTEIE